MIQNEDTNKIIGVVILFALVVLLIIFNSGIRLAEKLIGCDYPKIITQPTITPAVALPNPNHYYFIECANGDKAMIFSGGIAYAYICEEGKWIGGPSL